MNASVNPQTIEFFQQTLLRWFQKHGRDLPWRKTRDPYQILVSEFMLQQTQVVRVQNEYFYQFLEKFPSVQALADADEPAVLEAWAGLGYYNRAKNLHKIAKMIISEFQGEFPKDYTQILNLPGIGKYTAGAILSFAFNLDFPIVDTNVQRILKRVFLQDLKEKSPTKRENIIWNLSEKVLLKGDAWTFNQAILDLGALLCIAQKPRCSKCPMRPICQYYQKKISKPDSILYWTRNS